MATSALGMGYDKPDLGFCVHVGAPPSPVSYYQQVGRAGRGIDRAPVVLLHSEADAGVWEYFATATIPDPDRMRRLLDALPRRGEQAASAVALEALTSIRRSRVDGMLKQLAVDGAAERAGSGWVATGEPWVFAREHYEGVVATRRREADIMRRYVRGRAVPDAAAPGGAGRSVRRAVRALLGVPGPPAGRRRPPGRRTRSPASVATLLRRGRHVVDPRLQWPGGAFGSRKRIPPDRQAAKGRALAFADAPEWRELIDAAFAGDAPAAPELLDAVVGPAERLARRVAGAARGGGGPPRRRVPGADGQRGGPHRRGRSPARR